MQYINSLDRKKLTIASLVVAAFFLFFVNILATSEIKNAQVDLTESGLFTLSDGTLKVIGQIDEPLTFRFYYSKKIPQSYSIFC